MDAGRTFRTIHQVVRPTGKMLRVFVMVFAIAFSPLGVSFSTCHCAACDCSQSIDGACCCTGPAVEHSCVDACCQQDTLRTTASILVECDSNSSDEECSCDCHDCHCDVGIAIDPTPLPGINDASKPTLDATPQVYEILPAERSLLTEIIRPQIRLTK